MDSVTSDWPGYQGDYVLGDPKSPVAVLIIGRGAVEVPAELFCIKGILKTENVGLEKVILNVVANPGIRILLVCGREEFGHFPADAVLKLFENGLDQDRRIIGAKSAIPFLCSLPLEAVERFRDQVEVVDMVHPKDSLEIVAMDPIYQFEGERREELIAKARDLNLSGPGPYPGEGMRFLIPGLMSSSDRLGYQLHKTADVIIENMLCMPSERLKTDAGMAVISDDFGVAVDPVSGMAFQGPNVELAQRMRTYFTGC